MFFLLRVDGFMLFLRVWRNRWILMRAFLYEHWLGTALACEQPW